MIVRRQTSPVLDGVLKLGGWWGVWWSTMSTPVLEMIPIGPQVNETCTTYRVPSSRKYPPFHKRFLRNLSRRNALFTHTNAHLTLVHWPILCCANMYYSSFSKKNIRDKGVQEKTRRVMYWIWIVKVKTFSHTTLSLFPLSSLMQCNVILDVHVHNHYLKQSIPQN